MIPSSAVTLAGIFASLLRPSLCSPTHPPNEQDTHHHPHTPIDKRSAQEVVAQLNLTANPEKGFFIETFRDGATVANGTRAASTAIYYLLEGAAGDSVWHRVDAAEVWHHYAGAPLVLSRSRDDGAPVTRQALGPDVFAGQAPQLVVGAGEWQSARSLGEWTLVGTTVAPGFIPSGVELAEPDWKPNGA